MKTLNKSDWAHSCFNPFSGEVISESGAVPGVYFDEAQKITALDVLKLESYPQPKDIISVVFRGKGWLSKTEILKVEDAFIEVLALDPEEVKGLPLTHFAARLSKSIGWDGVLEFVIEKLT